MSTRFDSLKRTLLDITQRHQRAVVAVFLSVALGAVVALIAAQTGNDETDLNDTWSLPETDEVVLTSPIETILAEPLFGGEPVLPEKVETVEDVIETETVGDPWRLLGIVMEGTKRYAVIRNETLNRLQHVEPGELLPGGERLIAVDENSIRYEDQSDEIETSLFRDVRKTED